MLPAEIHFDATGALNGSDSRLIWEIVANISPLPDILHRHGLTAQDLKAKLKSAPFIAAYKEVKAAWHSDLNVQQRIKLKSGLLLEDSLQDLMLIIKDPMMSAANKMEATKQLGQLSQTTNPKPGAGDGGSKFTVKINIGGGDAAPKTVTIDGHAIAGPSADISSVAE